MSIQRNEKSETQWFHSDLTVIGPVFQHTTYLSFVIDDSDSFFLVL